jgi:hypothetical protein
MNYWITTHWPRWVDDPMPQQGVWVQDGKEHVISALREGDFVFIYEHKTGPTELDDDGKSRRRQPGRGGIVTHGRVDGPYEEYSERSEYANGKCLWWRWGAPTAPTKHKGFLPRTKVARILRYSLDYTFRGFGDDHSGLMKIDKKSYDAILASFIS